MRGALRRRGAAGAAELELALEEALDELAELVVFLGTATTSPLPSRRQMTGRGIDTGLPALRRLAVR